MNASLGNPHWYFLFRGGGRVQVPLVPSVPPSLNPDFLEASLASVASIHCEIASVPVMVYRQMLAHCSKCDRYDSQLRASECYRLDRLR
jgi:hypothetical protein